VFDDLQREFRLRATYDMDQELIDALTQQHIGLDDPNITPAFLEGEPSDFMGVHLFKPAAVERSRPTAAGPSRGLPHPSAR
jgi:hypothetical protein